MTLIKKCICSICSKALKKDKFSPSAWLSPNPQYRRCRACRSMLKKRYRERYREQYKEQRGRMKANAIKNHPDREYIKKIAHSTLRNARRRGIKYDMEPYQLRDWFLKQKQKCEYCGSTLNQIKKFYKKIGGYFVDRRLQMDRKDTNLGYKFDNIAICCRICNDHKSDFFSYKDFKVIAKKYIKKEINKKIK